MRGLLDEVCMCSFRQACKQQMHAAQKIFKSLHCIHWSYFGPCVLPCATLPATHVHSPGACPPWQRPSLVHNLRGRVLTRPACTGADQVTIVPSDKHCITANKPRIARSRACHAQRTPHAPVEVAGREQTHGLRTLSAPAL